MSAIQVDSISKSFQKGFFPNKVSVLKTLSFTVRSGVITGFLGGNGAGKTTTIKCLLNLIFPDEGHVSFFYQKQSFYDVRHKIGYLPEQPYFYDYLTGEEFLLFYGQLSDLPRKQIKERTEKLLNQMNLVYAKNRTLRTYSKGMLQKIGLAQALIHEPEIIILDEPMSGLDPDGRWAMSEVIKETAKQGVTLFFSSHLLHDVEALCEDLVILKEGSVFYQGTQKSFINSENHIYSLITASGQRIEVHGLSDLQLRIDEIRSHGGIIIECKKEISSLEEVFKKRALK